MAKVAVITDSTAYIPKELSQGLPIFTTPLHIHWGSEHFLDGVTIQPGAFYDRLAKTQVMPTTSQVTPEDFKPLYSRLLEQGYQILGIYLSSKFTSTLASAIQTKENLRSNAIDLVDSCTGAMALGFQVLAAARAAVSGASLQECKAIAENARANSNTFFTVSTLEFLRRGGRIGGAAAFLGSMLQLKPILETRNGIIEAVERVRTMSKAVDRLLDLAVEQIGARTPVHIAAMHSNLPETASILLEHARQKLAANNVSEAVVTHISPAIGIHVGPGGIGLAYMAGM
jgi:DegV family protein with EDD domain